MGAAIEIITLWGWVESQGVIAIILFLGALGIFIWKVIGPKIFPKAYKKKCYSVQDEQSRWDSGINIQQRIDFLLNIKRVELQMNHLEYVLEDILDNMKKIYARLLKNITGENTGLINHREYKGYSILLDSIKMCIISQCRTEYKRNHIPDNEAEFLDWSEKLFHKVNTTITEELNIWYPEEAIISREALYDAHYGKIPEIMVDGTPGIIYYLEKEMCKHFRSIRDISTEQKISVQEMQEEQAKISPNGLIIMGTL